MTDTSPEIAEMVRAPLMALSGAERFRMGVVDAAAEAAEHLAREAGATARLEALTGEGEEGGW